MNPLPPAFHLMAAASLLLLGGCAAQTAFIDGQALVSQGREGEGLAKLEEASRLEPGDARYRMAVLLSRERVAAGKAQQAWALVDKGRLDEAATLTRDALASGQLDAARGGGLLEAIAASRRIQVALAEMRAALERKEPEVAAQQARIVLLADPRHAEARAALQQIEEASVRPTPQGALASAYRKPITIEFKDAPLRSVFELISRTSGLNFLFDREVRTDQKTSIFLKNSTIEAAVRMTLLTNQLEQRVLDANTVLVYPNTAAKHKEYQPLTVRSFYLGNGDAKSVAASLKALLKARDVVVDEKLNLVIVRDTPEAIRLAEKVVALHDLPEPEVMLEVEVLEVKRTSLVDLGVRWPSQVALSPLPLVTGTNLTLADLRGLNSSRIAAAVDPLSLRTNKTDSDAKILANPRVRARNHEKAKILIGQRVPNITTTATSSGFVSETVQYVDVGLKLDVEPTIYLEGEVAIKIQMEVSNIISQLQTKAGSIAYEIGTRTAQTVLRLRDGENQILAGLISDEDRRSGNRVPGLGDIPVAGRLFGEQTNDTSKTEIVLSITPRILRNVRRPAPALLEFDSGTENSLGAPPTTGGTVSAASSFAGPAAAPRNLPAPASPVAGGAPRSALAPSSVIATPAGGPAAAASSAATVTWQGQNQLRAGDTFALQFVLNSSQPVLSVPFSLGFDPQVLQVVSMTEGELLRQGGAQTAFASRIDPKGQVTGTVTRTGTASGAVGQGTLATVNFRVVAAAPGQTQVQMITVAAVGPSGSQVPVATVSPFPIQLLP